MPLSALPAESVWALPVADTRAPLSVVLLRAGEDGLAIDAALAADFPILEYRTDAVTVQLGLLAGAFMEFGAGGQLTFNLQTFDGRFGLPIDARSGPWSARLEWVHVSAHYGDGVRKSGERPTNLDAYSRESVTLSGARDLPYSRLLIGARANLHTQPQVLPFAIQVAAEGYGPWPIAPYLAVDVQSAQEFAWSPSFAGQLGVQASQGPRRFRLALAARTGPDETGKTAGTPDTWLGVLFGFDATGRLTRAASP